MTHYHHDLIEATTVTSAVIYNTHYMDTKTLCLAFTEI